MGAQIGWPAGFVARVSQWLARSRSRLSSSYLPSVVSAGSQPDVAVASDHHVSLSPRLDLPPAERSHAASCLPAGSGLSEAAADVAHVTLEPDAAVLSDVAPPSLKVARGVAVGTSNPHMLPTAADRAPIPKRGAAFDPIAHRAAEHEELVRRPLPSCNVAPDTEPLPPPDPPPLPPLG